MRTHLGFVSVGAFLVVALSACVDSNDSAAPPDPSPTLQPATIPAGNATDGLVPFLDVPARISQLDIATQSQVPFGRRIALWNDRAYVTHVVGDPPGEILSILDTSDPWAPERLGGVEANLSAYEGVDVLNYGNRTVVAATLSAHGATDFSSGPVGFWDVTDPEAPRELARLGIISHTVAAHRPAHVVYSGGFLGGTKGGLEIMDARDPDNIHLAKTWSWGAAALDHTPLGQGGCHDVAVDSLRNRLYCAAVFQALVIDITDPFNPSVLTAATLYAAPEVRRLTTAFGILNGTVLVVGEENGDCLPARDTSLPYGALYFFDLATSPPTLLGYVSASSDPLVEYCAPHFGSEIVDGSGFLAFGYRPGGLFLIDASDPRAPKILDRDVSAGHVWDAKYYRGLVFTAGEKGGLQVAVPS